MLNELYQLSRCLKNCQVSAKKIHPWIQPPKKGNGLRVILDESAHIKKVEYVSAENMASLWNIKQSNHKMFPIVNLKTPLWNVQELSEIAQLLEFREKKVSVAKSFERIIEILQHADFCFEKSADLLNKVYQFPQGTLLSLSEQIEEFAAFDGLMHVCLQLHDEDLINRLIREFSDKFIEALQQGRIDDSSLMHSVLFGKWQEKENKFGEESITVIFDVDEDDLPVVCVRMASDEMKKYINDRLFSTQGASGGELFNTKGKPDAFGVAGTLAKKHPQPNLPILGPSYLMSMNENTPCHTRYGHIGSAIFPISEEITNAASDAVQHLTKIENKGKTWDKVPCGKVGENDLLLAYLENMPDSDAYVASTLGTGDEGKDFENYAKTACEMLRLKLPNQETSYIRLLLLQSVNKGQRAVRFETGFTVKELDEAVRFWCDAARNVPPFYVPLTTEEGKIEMTRPAAPYLGHIFQELQFQWLNNGSNRKDIKGGRLGDMYQLFLHPTQRCAAYFLEVVLRRSAVFWVRFKYEYAQPKRLRIWKDKEFEEYKKIMLDSVAFTGILLEILGREKEEYMKSSGYYVGRLLSLADLLHEQYCIHVRNKGDKTKGLPPQLIGNSLMRNAMDNPAQTLARLQERLMVYYAWATKEQGEKIGLAKWAMIQMGEISEALSKLELPTRTNDTMKAEILLGYLAKPETANKQQASQNQNQSEENSK